MLMNKLTPNTHRLWAEKDGGIHLLESTLLDIETDNLTGELSRVTAQSKEIARALEQLLHCSGIAEGSYMADPFKPLVAQSHLFEGRAVPPLPNPKL